ncbi:hypothetical protein MLD52_15555 [Puniceicoccaceae bacterium K14]|nr:hypothetical protein [Puniceicoccaceae bacterium K14]
MKVLFKIFDFQIRFLELFCLIVGGVFALDLRADDLVNVSAIAKRLSLADTKSEGAWMEPMAQISDGSEGSMTWRMGDIDNFGQTWRIAHNPFSGEIASRLEKGVIPEAALEKLPKGVDEESYILGLAVSGGELDGVTDSVFNQSLAETSPSSFELQLPLDGFSRTVERLVLQFYLVSSGQSEDQNEWAVSVNGKSLPELGRLISLTKMRPRQGYLFSYQIDANHIDPDNPIISIQLGFDDRRSHTEFALDFIKVIADCDTPNFDGVVHGIVRSSGSARPVPSVLVSCQGKTIRTDEGGTFRFDSISAGQAYVCVDGDLDNFKTISVFDGDTLKLYFAK